MTNAKLLEALHEGRVDWKIKRYANAEDFGCNKQYSDDKAIALFGAKQNTSIDGNIMLNEGINELWTLVCSASGTEFDNSNSYLGVGDDATTEAAAQTGLQAAVNKKYKAMDSGYPTYGTSQKATWKATFASADANYDWREFTVANGASGGCVNLNRKVSSQGTKASGQSWELSLEITLS